MTFSCWVLAELVFLQGDGGRDAILLLARLGYRPRAFHDGGVAQIAASFFEEGFKEIRLLLLYVRVACQRPLGAAPLCGVDAFEYHSVYGSFPQHIAVLGHFGHIHGNCGKIGTFQSRSGTCQVVLQARLLLFASCCPCRGQGAKHEHQHHGNLFHHLLLFYFSD